MSCQVPFCCKPCLCYDTGAGFHATKHAHCMQISMAHQVLLDGGSREQEQVHEGAVPVVDLLALAFMPAISASVHIVMDSMPDEGVYLNRC